MAERLKKVGNLLRSNIGPSIYIGSRIVAYITTEMSFARGGHEGNPVPFVQAIVNAGPIQAALYEIAITGVLLSGISLARRKGLTRMANISMFYVNMFSCFDALTNAFGLAGILGFSVNK